LNEYDQDKSFSTLKGHGQLFLKVKFNLYITKRSCPKEHCLLVNMNKLN